MRWYIPAERHLDSFHEDTPSQHCVRLCIMSRLPRQEHLVAPVQRVGSSDDAIARANALPYGLGANVYTRRMDYILRCMEELEAARWFNDPPPTTTGRSAA